MADQRFKKIMNRLASIIAMISSVNYQIDALENLGIAGRILVLSGAFTNK
jgi:hypothetical protein